MLPSTTTCHGKRHRNIHSNKNNRRINHNAFWMCFPCFPMLFDAFSMFLSIAFHASQFVIILVSMFSNACSKLSQYFSMFFNACQYIFNAFQWLCNASQCFSMLLYDFQVFLYFVYTLSMLLLHSMIYPMCFRLFRVVWECCLKLLSICAKVMNKLNTCVLAAGRPSKWPGHNVSITAHLSISDQYHPIE